MLTRSAMICAMTGVVSLGVPVQLDGHVEPRATAIVHLLRRSELTVLRP